MRKTFCEPQPIPFLCSLHIARTPRWEESASNRVVSEFRLAVRHCGPVRRPTRENTHSLSSANELRGCELAARPDLRTCCTGTPFEESPFHEGGAHLTSQPRPFLLLPFSQGTGSGSIGLAP